MSADSELFARIVRRDREAFAAFYDRWAPVLFPVCTRILADDAEAEDVLQAVFVQVWKDAGRYDPNRESLKTWIFSIARSRALDRRRRRNAAGSHDAASDPLPGPWAATDTAGGSLLRQDAIRQMGRLSVKERAVLEFAYFEGLTAGEIAARFGEPPGTVKGRARASLAKLHALLSGEQADS
jgi:RNA polymerase sigma-70 factor (ECF subfamily)